MFTKRYGNSLVAMTVCFIGKKKHLKVSLHT